MKFEICKIPKSPVVQFHWGGRGRRAGGGDGGVSDGGGGGGGAVRGLPALVPRSRPTY